jgi:DNA-binding MarR family transcriptional regulator
MLRGEASMPKAGLLSSNNDGGKDPYACLRLENQFCFPLYAAAKEVVRRYQPLLSALNLTYTQYIVLMVLWELQETNVSELGARLYLDSGTLTPLLRKLENKGYISRHRSENDKRELLVSITKEGLTLRDSALQIPYELESCIDLPQQDLIELRRISRELLDSCKS